MGYKKNKLKARSILGVETVSEVPHSMGFSTL
jgi:hypothetical protein